MCGVQRFCRIMETEDERWNDYHEGFTAVNFGSRQFLCMKDGLTVSEVAKRLSLPHGTLKNWVYAARQG